MLTTAILGPVLTAHFAPGMLPQRTPESIPEEEISMSAKVS